MLIFLQEFWNFWICHVIIVVAWIINRRIFQCLDTQNITYKLLYAVHLTCFTQSNRKFYYSAIKLNFDFFYMVYKKWKKKSQQKFSIMVTIHWSYLLYSPHNIDYLSYHIISKSYLSWQKLKLEMFYDDEIKFSSCFPPKTGITNWLKALIHQKHKYKQIRNLKDIFYDLPRYERSGLRERFEMKSGINDYVSFLTVRHPFSRILSAYRNWFH